MTQEFILGVVGAVAVVLAAVVGVPRLGRDIRSGISKDLEIYKALPESSVARAQLLSHIELRVQTLSSHDEARRSPTEIVLGITILIAAFVAGWFMVTWGGWWWFASPGVVFLLLLGGVGLGQGLSKRPRDERGRIVK